MKAGLRRVRMLLMGALAGAAVAFAAGMQMPKVMSDAPTTGGRLAHGDGGHGKGACSASDSVISMGKDSPACKQMRAQLGELDKAKASCAQSGAQRAQCEQMVAQSRTRIESMRK